MSDNKNNKKRFFNIITEEGARMGRYKGTRPSQAARKACKRLFKDIEKNESDENITFKIYECTRGSKHKTFEYEGFFKKLEENSENTFTSNSGDINFNYRYYAKKLKDNEE